MTKQSSNMRQGLKRRITTMRCRLASLYGRLSRAVHCYIAWQHSWKVSSVVLVVVFTSALSSWSMLHTEAATTTMLPNGDITKVWAVPSSGTTHYILVDDGATPNDSDYVSTGTNGTGGEVEEFALSSPSSVASASQVVVGARLLSGVNSTPDTVGIALRVNGTLQAITTVTPTASYTDYTVTYNGSWSQADVDSMQVYLIRNVLGTGPASGRDDNVRVSNVSADLTYVPSVQYDQSAYRWFENQDTSGASTLSFAAKTDYATGSGASFVANADLNADGRPDMVITNWNSNTVSVFLGTGTGTFQTKVDYATGSGASFVIPADFNSDGKLDLAVTNNGSSTVSILLGNGDGTFQSKVDYATGSSPYSVTAADFNGDSKPDLAVTGYAVPGTVSILLGNGDGTFQSKVDYTVGDTPQSVTTTDFNGDSKPDLAVANNGSDTVSILLGNGDGTFQSKVDYATGNAPRSVTSADFNADSKPDLAVANYTSSTVSILLGNGDGTFQSKVDYATGTFPYSVTSVDFDADGKPDLAVANMLSSTVSILLGNGDGTFQSKVDYATGSNPYSVTSADFDADGRSDMATANNNSNTVSVFLNTSLPPPIDVAAPLAAQDTAATAPTEGTIFRLRLDLHISSGQLNASAGQFKLRYTEKTALTCDAEPSTSYTDVTATSTIRYADNLIAQNGQSIVANANDPKHGTDTTIAQSYQEKWATAFTNPNIISIGQDGMWDFALVANRSIQNTHYCFKVTNDSNGDLNSYAVYPELIIPAATLTQASYRWFANQDATSAASVSFAPKVDYTTGSAPYSVTSADFNADSKPDLAVVNYSSASVSILLGTGTGSFQAKTDYATGSGPRSVFTADFDGDGKLDLAIANNGVNTVSILLGNGDGTFQAKADYATDTNLYSVTSADFNGDGKLDLATANSTSSTASVLLNSGTGTFQPKVDYATGSVPYSVTSADFNGDGKLDLATGNCNTNNASIFVGNGDGTFQAKVDYATGNCPYSVTSADFNGDGKLDLATANTNDSTASILLGNGNGTFQAKADYATGTWPHSVTSADFNGDGKLDLATANYSGNTASILLGNGNGTFQAKADYATGTNSQSVTTADFNADSRLDLAVVNYGSNTISALLNTSGITVGAPLANQTTATDLIGPALGQPFRLRLAARLVGAGVTSNTLSLKLQYARMSGSCTLTPSGDYADITSSTDVRFHDNPIAPSVFAPVGGSNDPTDGTNSSRLQSYNEANPFTNNASEIYAGQAGMWDFPLVIAATGSHVSYCLRAVHNTGSLFSSYGTSPEFSVAPAMHRLMRGGNWFGSAGIKQNKDL